MGGLGGEGRGWATDGCEEEFMCVPQPPEQRNASKAIFFPSSEVAIMINMFTLEKLKLYNHGEKKKCEKI